MVAQESKAGLFICTEAYFHVFDSGMEMSSSDKSAPFLGFGFCICEVAPSISGILGMYKAKFFYSSLTRSNHNKITAICYV